MPVTNAAANRPDDLPIWARLNLSARKIPLDDVTCWERETATLIVAYLHNGAGYTYLYKR